MVTELASQKIAKHFLEFNEDQDRLMKAYQLFAKKNDQAQEMKVQHQEPKADQSSGEQFKSGDSLSKIAKRNGVTVDDILAANPQITNPDVIKAGAKIMLPSSKVLVKYPDSYKYGISVHEQKLKEAAFKELKTYDDKQLRELAKVLGVSVDNDKSTLDKFFSIINEINPFAIRPSEAAVPLVMAAGEACIINPACLAFVSRVLIASGFTAAGLKLLEEKGNIIYTLIHENDNKPLATPAHKIKKEDLVESFSAQENIPTTLSTPANKGEDLLKTPGFDIHDGNDLNILYKIWTDGKLKNPVENAYNHWEKHKQEFPELNNAKEYIEKAKEFANNPPETALIKTREHNGDKIVYDPPENRLVIIDKDGIPKTMFKPNPKIHGLKDNKEYFNAQ